MGASVSRRRGGQRGQAMVEFALGLPLLLVIVFAIVDFGRAYSVYVTVTNATREGARYGITNPTDTSGITSTVTDKASPYNDSNLTVSTPTCSPSPCTSGGSLTVTAQYSYSLITPLAGIVKLVSATTNLPTSWTISSSAVMRVE